MGALRARLRPLGTIFYAITQRIVWLVTAALIRLCTNFYIHGRENLHAVGTPLLVIANHQSYWDAMILGTLFPFFSNRYLPIGFLAVDALFENPIFNLFFRLTGTYPTYRGKGYDVSLAYPRAMLRRPGACVVFPFGKIDDGNITSMKPRRGIGILAKENDNLTILPIYLKTTSSLNPLDFLFGSKEMGVIAGPPFRLDATTRAGTVEEIAETLAEKIRALQTLRYPATVHDPDEFLRESYYCNYRHPLIENLARQLTVGLDDQREIAVRLFYWVRDGILYQVGNWNRRASETLALGGGTCTNKANLFVALLRARGVPTGYRVLRVNGQEYFGPIAPPMLRHRVGARSLHVHACVLLDGRWVHCDPSDDIVLSLRTSAFNPQSKAVEWDGTQDALLNLDLVHVIEDLGMFGSIDAIMRKEPQSSKRTVVRVGNLYLKFLREYEGLIEDVNQLERHFRVWLRKHHFVHYLALRFDALWYTIRTVIRRIAPRKS